MTLQTIIKNKRSKGFSLIEALIVVLILGIITTAALPSIQEALAVSKLSEAAGEINLALEYAQLSAMTTGAETRVTIDNTANSILVARFEITGDVFGGLTEMPENDIESGAFVNMAHPTNRGENYTISFADEDRFNGIDITAAAFGANNYVTYDAIGVPSDGGTVTLFLGSKQITLTVDPLTGKVTSSG